jgi:hypothetical protein
VPFQRNEATICHVSRRLRPSYWKMAVKLNHILLMAEEMRARVVRMTKRGVIQYHFREMSQPDHLFFKKSIKNKNNILVAQNTSTI